MLNMADSMTELHTGCFFNWDPPKNHKYWKKLKYPNWDPPKISQLWKTHLNCNRFSGKATSELETDKCSTAALSVSIAAQALRDSEMKCHE